MRNLNPMMYLNPGAAGCTQKCANGLISRFSLGSENLRNFSSGPKSKIFNALSAQMVKFSQNELRGRENLFTQANLRPQKSFITFSVWLSCETYFYLKIKLGQIYDKNERRCFLEETKTVWSNVKFFIDELHLHFFVCRLQPPEVDFACSPRVNTPKKINI